MGSHTSGVDKNYDYKPSLIFVGLRKTIEKGGMLQESSASEDKD
jgi:hypothetical protein